LAYPVKCLKEASAGNDVYLRADIDLGRGDGALRADAKFEAENLGVNLELARN
jgi:hypothetical protein